MERTEPGSKWPDTHMLLEYVPSFCSQELKKPGTDSLVSKFFRSVWLMRFFLGGTLVDEILSTPDNEYWFDLKS